MSHKEKQLRRELIIQAGIRKFREVQREQDYQKLRQNVGREVEGNGQPFDPAEASLQGSGAWFEKKYPTLVDDKSFVFIDAIDPKLWEIAGKSKCAHTLILEALNVIHIVDQDGVITGNMPGNIFRYSRTWSLEILESIRNLQTGRPNIHNASGEGPSELTIDRYIDATILSELMPGKLNSRDFK